MKTNLKIFGVLIFCLSASLIIPKVADATGTFQRLSSRHDSQLARYSGQDQKSMQEVYVPPNYGGPDSQHGSGTR
jgi:hypothetical protein